ncbi:hypothetical protein ACLK2A_16675 [Escherichia coli]
MMKLVIILVVLLPVKFSRLTNN